MSKKSKVIINADDFGLSISVNRAIADAFKNGLISNTTLIANGNAFNDAIKTAKDNNFQKRVGIHFNLTEGEPLTQSIKNCPSFCENGVFHHRNNRLKPLDRFEKNAIYEELSAQVQRIRSAGFTIDHADSHHHIHTAIFIAPVVFRVCKENGINKIRLHRNIGNIPGYKLFIKKLYNRELNKEGFITTDYFGSLQDISGTPLPDNLEIMVHPDYDKDGVLIDRADSIDDMPVGMPLHSLTQQKGIELKTYGDL